MRAVITGTGSYLPERIMTNDDWCEFVETSDEWIRARTGIVQRHIAAEHETTATLAAEAAKAALADAGIDAGSIDAIIVATSTPERAMPSTACLVQKAIGNSHAFAFDIAAACSGFVFGLQLANQQIQSGAAKRVLLIGAETMSRLIDWTDRGTCILFGDGAGAVVLEAQDVDDRGIVATKLYSDGSYADILKTENQMLQMQGQEVFRHGVEKMASATKEMLETHDLPLDAVDWLVPHQANMRIIQSIGKKLKLEEGRAVVTLDVHANTSAASIPLALDVAAKEGRFKQKDLLVCPALGAGLTWACCLLQW
jgi:3-oxoacyl-[acyl-carrier-protein] synthase-3